MSKSLDQTLDKRSALVRKNFCNTDCTRDFRRIYENFYTYGQINKCRDSNDKIQLKFEKNHHERKSLKELGGKQDISFVIEVCPQKEDINTIRSILFMEAISQVSFRFGKNISDNDFKTSLELISICIDNIETLSIKLEGCKKITDSSISELLDKYLAKMTKLKDLTLNLGNTQASSTVLKIFQDRGLKSVKKLNLNLNWLNITDNHLKQMITGVQQEELANLKSLSLGLRCGSLSGAFLHDLKDNFLNKIESIEEITVDMDDSNMDYEEEIALKEINNFIRKK